MTNIYTPAYPEWCDHCNYLINGDAIWIEDKDPRFVTVVCLECADIDTPRIHLNSTMKGGEQNEFS